MSKPKSQQPQTKKQQLKKKLLQKANNTSPRKDADFRRFFYVNLRSFFVDFTQILAEEDADFRRFRKNLCEISSKSYLTDNGGTKICPNSNYFLSEPRKPLIFAPKSLHLHP